MEDLDVELFKLLVTVGFVFLTWVGHFLDHVSAMKSADLTSGPVCLRPLIFSLSNCGLKITQYIV